MRKILLFNLLMLFAFSAFCQEKYPASIRQVLGTPTLFLDGKPCFASAVRINIEDGTVSRFLFQKEGNIFQQFSRTGTPIFFLGTNMGWNGVDTYDYEYFDRVMDRIFADYPQAYVIPSMHLYRTGWFGVVYPEEAFAMLDEKGGKSYMRHCPSYFSMKFEAAAKIAMEKFIRHIEEKNYAGRIAGYQVNFGRTAEWVWWDLARRRGDASLPGLTAWRKFLREKYVTIEVLNKAHGSSWKSFDEIGPFQGTFYTDFAGGFIRDAKLDAAKCDYNKMVNLRQMQLKRSLCGCVKNATGGKALVGIYNYFDQAELEGAPEIDFTVSSTIYTDRAAGGTAISQARQLEHLRRTGKLYFHDSDMRTVLSIENYWYSAFNLFDSISMMCREFGTMLAKGAGNIWFSLNPNRNVFDNPELMRCVAETEALGEVVVEKRHLDLRSNAEIAFVIDRQGDTGFWGQYTFNTCIGRVGAAVDCFPSHRLDLIGEQYKLVIFASCPQLDEKAVNALKKNGRTLLFLYAAGMQTPDGLDAGRLSALAGIDIVCSGIAERMVKVEEKYQARYGKKALFIGRNGVPAHAFRLTAVPDDGTQVIARSVIDGEPVFVQKDMGTWRSVFFGDYQMRSDWIQQLAREAGVKICDDSTMAFFYRNKSILVVSAEHDGGDKIFHLNPGEKAVLDVFAQKLVPVRNGNVVLRGMMPCETRILLVAESESIAKQYLQDYREALARRNVLRKQLVFQCRFLPAEGPGYFVRKGTKRKIHFCLDSNGDYKELHVALPLSSRWKCSGMTVTELQKYETRTLAMEIEALADTGSDSVSLIVTDGTGKEISRSVPRLFHCTPYTCLSDLDWASATTGWGKIHRDASCMGRILATGGRSHPKGLGVHANSRIVYDLQGKWSCLRGRAGIDAAQSTGGKGVASCVFTIRGDGKILFQSPPLYGGGEAKEFSVNLTGMKKLELLVDDAGDGTKCDNADWCGMALYP